MIHLLWFVVILLSFVFIAIVLLTPDSRGELFC
jgi:hypothetical protein